jgi:hypothetical protein
VKTVEGPELLLPAEVAGMLFISVKTLQRQRRERRLGLHVILTPGGAPRYSRREVEQLLNGRPR